MTYAEKLRELEGLLVETTARIDHARARYDIACRKYGRTAGTFARVPHGLYAEQQRIELELEGMGYIGNTDMADGPPMLPMPSARP